MLCLVDRVDISKSLHRCLAKELKYSLLRKIFVRFCIEDSADFLSLLQYELMFPPQPQLNKYAYSFLPYAHIIWLQDALNELVILIWGVFLT